MMEAQRDEHPDRIDFQHATLHHSKEHDPRPCACEPVHSRKRQSHLQMTRPRGGFPPRAARTRWLENPTASEALRSAPMSPPQRSEGLPRVDNATRLARDSAVRSAVAALLCPKRFWMRSLSHRQSEPASATVPCDSTLRHPASDFPSRDLSIGFPFQRLTSWLLGRLPSHAIV